MASIIDRRKNSKGNSSPNRQRFIKRVEDQIKKAIPNIVDGEPIKDLSSGKGKIKVPVKGIKEPKFIYDTSTGNKKYIHPGNKEYVEGDKIRKPPSGKGGRGRKGSNDPSVTEDEFTITISREEFLDYFFKDLELPDLVKKKLKENVEFKYKRAGYSNEGIPARLNIVNSFKNSMARRISMQAFYENKIKELKELLNTKISEEERIEIEEKIDKYEKLKLIIPYMDDVDLRYNNFEPKPIPSFNAVMFCIMDVSGSMGYEEKDIAKRFFILLYMFLTKQYDKIDIVFIRHHTKAAEVSEQEFFESRESGGTIVAPSLRLMNDIIEDRYSKDWNIYAAQISDGDVWNKDDADECYGLLKKDILKKLQYMIYVEVCRDGQGDLWSNYSLLANSEANFTCKAINNVKEIWPAFKDLFKKQGA